MWIIRHSSDTSCAVRQMSISMWGEHDYSFRCILFSDRCTSANIYFADRLNIVIHHELLFAAVMPTIRVVLR